MPVAPGEWWAKGERIVYRAYVATSGWELADAKALDEKAKRNVKNKLVGRYSIMCRVDEGKMQWFSMTASSAFSR